MAKSLTVKSNGKKKSAASIGDAVLELEGTFKQRVKNFDSYAKRIGDMMKENIAQNLEAGRSGQLGWPKLMKSTYVNRALRGYPIHRYPVLKRTGALEGGFKKLEVNVVSEGRKEIKLVNIVPHAHFQNYGGTS